MWSEIQTLRESDRKGPLPVITPIRAHISSVTYSAIVMGISDHSKAYPYCAPACVYVEIPPASLSTLEVISPGPTTAISSVKRRRNPRMRIRRSVPRPRAPSSFSAMACQFIAAGILFLFFLFLYFATSRTFISSPVATPHHPR